MLDFKHSLGAHYAAGHSSEQALLKTQIELAELKRKQLALDEHLRIIKYQINTLLHQPLETPLAPAPKHLAPPPKINFPTHQSHASPHEHPAIAAAAYTLKAARSTLHFSQRNYYPDFHFNAAYNAMWPEMEHRFMLGFAINIPLQLYSRNAMVQEAKANLAAAQANLHNNIDDIRLQQAACRAKLANARAILKLYQTDILPAATSQRKAAQIGYEAGRQNLTHLLDTELAFNKIQLQYHRAQNDIWRHYAKLRFAYALPLPSSASEDNPS
ncbi:MAG TPA: hypothetical protein EYO59_12830 [Chromatiaceae bacterium]|nr:hypothetical protein [Chromatiaceae bacterium]